MTSKRIYHPLIGKVVLDFNETTHTYIINDQKYISATTLISQFFPKFETEKISYYYARKHNLNQIDVKAMWAKEGEISIILGNKCHQFAECVLNGNMQDVPIPTNEKERRYFKHIDACIVQLLRQYDLIATEYIIFDPTSLVSGTVDLIMKDKLSDKIIILDWKSNKKIEFDNNYNKWGFQCCSNLGNCNWNTYSLQLNMYEYILRSNNYFDTDMWGRGLLHITNDVVKPYKVENFRSYIEVMIAEHRA